jgi:hypothetical protein
MPGIDAGELQCRFFDIGPLEGNDSMGKGLVNFQLAIVGHIQQHRTDFQNGVGTGIEAAGFHIDDNREKSAKTFRQQGWLLLVRIAHG